MNNLEHRAVSCIKWRWIPGMMVKGKIWDYSPAGQTEIKSSMLITRVDNGRPMHGLEPIRECLPVLDHPTTLGCLLYLVRECWPMAPATVASHWTWCEPERRDRRMWVCSYLEEDTYKQCSGNSEIECLVKTLEEYKDKK
jgi:hypothetical protein